MSDGGAQVIVAMGEGVVKLAQFKVGRVVLWFIAAYLTLAAITARGEGSWLFFAALFIAAVALGAGFLAERRKRAERAALRTTFMVLGLAFVSVAGGVFLLLRRKKEEVIAPPPTQAEIDALLKEGGS
ncbi:MAG: hypothetical protein QM817_29340 [Archangium sp.]